MNQKVKIATLFFSIILLWASCTKRYVYFNKVKAIPKRGVFTLSLENQSPQFLSREFEGEIKEYAIKRMDKQGYKYSEESPQYAVILKMGVDSFWGTGEVYALPYKYMYSKRSKEIFLDLEIIYLANNKAVYKDQYGLYFFNNYPRDLSRTKGIVKYMLGGINE